MILTEAEAAAALKLSARTLQRLRLAGDGPAYVQLGGRRVGYTPAALAGWIASRTTTSTSDRARRFA